MSAERGRASMPARLAQRSRATAGNQRSVFARSENLGQVRDHADAEPALMPCGGGVGLDDSGLSRWRNTNNLVSVQVMLGSIGYRVPAPEVFVPALTAWPAAQPRPAPPAMLSAGAKTHP